MQDYSIDLASERITHPRTKEYFREVMSSYAIGNYRSAVASLYTIVISDLVFKLKDQVERENDEGANQILRAVEDERNKDETSSKWETMLVDKIFKETKLLELRDKAAIEHLKKQRNLSSHPNILDTEDNILFTPHKEDVRAHIRSMLEGILTKSSAHTEKLVNTIIEFRIPELYERSDGDSDYERRFTNRYLKDLNEKAISSLFKKLWKFTFRLVDDDCNKNRDVNARTLQLITSLYNDIAHRCISSEPSFYSNVTINVNEPLIKLMDFFNSNPRMFKLLDKDIQKDIEKSIKINPEYYISSVFLSGAIEQHLINATEYLKGQVITIPCLRTYEVLTKELDKPNLFVKLVFKYYSQSNNYVDGYSRFHMVERLVPLESLNETEYHDLLKIMNSNSDIYNEMDRPLIVAKIQKAAELKLGKKLDMSSYSRLK